MPSHLLRLVVAVPLAAVFLTAVPAVAHQRAALTIEFPDEGSTVGTGRVDVLIVATGAAIASVDFAVRLDDQPVDVTGDVGGGSVFIAHSLRAGDQVHLRVPVADAGEHELRLVYAPDPDDPRPDVVRRFSTDPNTTTEFVTSKGGFFIPWSILLGALVVVGAAVVVRRSRRGGSG